MSSTQLVSYARTHNMEAVLSKAVNRAVKASSADPFAVIEETILSEQLVRRPAFGAAEYPGLTRKFCASQTPVAVGSRLPPIELGVPGQFGAPPDGVNIADYVAGRRVIMLGLPGAFTSC